MASLRVGYTLVSGKKKITLLCSYELASPFTDRPCLLLWSLLGTCQAWNYPLTKIACRAYSIAFDCSFPLLQVVKPACHKTIIQIAIYKTTVRDGHAGSKWLFTKLLKQQHTKRIWIQLPSFMFWSWRWTKLLYYFKERAKAGKKILEQNVSMGAGYWYIQWL